MNPPRFRLDPAALVVALAGLLVALPTASPAAEAPVDRPASTIDPHSHGNPHQIRVEHIELSLSVDFDLKMLAGSATLRAKRQPGSPPIAPLILDARGLQIRAVIARRGATDRWVDVSHRLGPADPILGQAVTIDLAGAPVDFGGPEVEVNVEYTTPPTAGALQWLDPGQTTGGKHPFLFTQSQAIQARTWIPCQDTPGVRVTYEAWVTTPKDLKAVMAADAVPPRERQPVGTNHFRMDRPIPPYLIALAVGDLAFKPLGPRTGVWAEPATIEKAAYEFADTEKMVEATEARFGPYRWGRYDLLVLPPSFPFGGMENPKLTFATPTVLAGDRSLVALVAHELAHSWSGNLVTNATWDDFWLNEGFTVYLERRIVEAVYGEDRRRMEAVLGLGELRDDLARLDAQDQRLHLDLKGRDPDDGMNQVAYEKGALFLTELERVFGRERFDPFLRGYFDAHAFRSITTADFEAYLKAHLLDPNPDLAAKIDVAAWVHRPGLDVPFAEPHSERLDAANRAASGFGLGKVSAAKLATAGWTTQEWLQFLRKLPDPLDVTRMGELDAAFRLTDRQNAEVAGQWLLMAAKNRYHPADARIEAFLTSVGRRKFIVPIYRELMKTPEGAERARAIYAKARPTYHPIAVESVDKLLGR